jgi:hypothetical protein
MLATAGLLLFHKPPGVVLDNVVDIPRHMLVKPDIAEGFALTVTVSVREQPLVIV